MASWSPGVLPSFLEISIKFSFGATFSDAELAPEALPVRSGRDRGRRCWGSLKEKPDSDIVVLLAGSPVTRDLQPNRMRIFVDTVAETP
ncbi:Subtilisin-chymotrypsin inhibitor-2A [Hordeum vulgare]|nr:Subtilisin-chymotrypsin inhibitor-2A [Hordeum vulgare]